jgi:hypothetical protein
MKRFNLLKKNLKIYILPFAPKTIFWIWEDEKGKEMINKLKNTKNMLGMAEFLFHELHTTVKKLTLWLWIPYKKTAYNRCKWTFDDFFT